MVTFAWVDLAQPRALTAAEFAVLEALVAHAGSAPLTAQLASARVTGTCGCGCSSIRLDADGPPVPPEAMQALGGRDDYIGVHATAPGDPPVDTVAHVPGGRLGELEFFAGEGLPLPPPAPTSLRDFWIG